MKEKVLAAHDDVPDCNNNRKEDSKCRFGCPKKLSSSRRRDIRNNFYEKCGSYEMQNVVLSDNMVRKMKAQMSTENRSSRREFTVQYFLTNERYEKIQVCKPMFRLTFGIGEKRCRTVLEKKHSDDLYTVKFKHRNSGHSPNNKIKIETEMNMIDFIKMFPTVPSHYRRKESKKFYIEGALNAEKMFKIYEDEYGETEHEVIKSTFQRCLSKFDIGFNKPKKDDCPQCTRYKNEEKTPESEARQVEHLRRRDLSRKEKEKDKKRSETDDSFAAIIVDMERVKPCPMSSSAEFFYISKLSCYNFSIYDFGTKNGICYLWDQTRSKRGANECGSCLYDYVARLPSTTKELVIWADTCGGQNRNKQLGA